MLLTIVTILFVTGLVVQTSAFAIKPHKDEINFKKVPSVSFESPQTADHANLTMGLYWGWLYSTTDWINNATDTWNFTSGPEPGCNTIKQLVKWPFLSVYYEYAEATVGEETAYGSVHGTLGKAVFEVAITACKEDDQYELDYGVSSPQKDVELNIYEMETLEPEFLKPGVVEELEDKIWTSVVGLLAEYVTPLLEQRAETNLNRRRKFGSEKFARKLANATPAAFPTVDLSAR